LQVATIGPESSRAAREAGLAVVAEAKEHSSDGLVAAVESLTS
jgi:uroporphyrinogen-III synthase